MPKSDTKLTVKCQNSDLELWKEAAHIRRTTLSDWVRQTLNAAAGAMIARPSADD